MIHFSFGSNQDFYSFVVSALVSEASKEEKRILLDHRISKEYTADIFLPNGLSIFGHEYVSPFVVEINKEYNRDKTNYLAETLKRIGFKGTLFYISQDAWITNPLIIDEFDIVPLGYNFLNQLRERNPDAYLNHILGNPKTSLKKEAKVLRERELVRNQDLDHILFLVEGKNEEYLVREDDPDRINAINEKEFIAHLNDDSEKSNCAVIIGNGVSIPFGSDNWSTMIKNLVDSLEPFHI